MSEHTPNLCICGERPNLVKSAPTVSHEVLWQVCCPSTACGELRGRIRGDADQAIADWNRQTAAPDLLAACRVALPAFPRKGEMAKTIRNAITRAEPKP